jgi:site-specific recombinase XerD
MPPRKKIILDEAPREITVLQPQDTLYFDLVMALQGRVSSVHTLRAYYRWIDNYLMMMAGLPPVANGRQREQRLRRLPINLVVESLSAPQLRAWLGQLNQQEHGRQGIGQARAAMTTTASLLSEAGWLHDHVSAGMSNVRPPRAEDGQRPGRWLSTDQIKLLMEGAVLIGKNEHMQQRNRVVITMLCTMALRRDELSKARWGDLSVQNNRPVLIVHGKGRKQALIDVPKPVIKALTVWQTAVAPTRALPPQDTPLVRRINKNGTVSQHNLTTSGIWWIINEASAFANIGHVAPHDLRRSVAGALQENGVSIEVISRLLRHSNVAVTERYLSRLPQQNMGAIEMSNVLGLENDEWPGFETVEET